LFYVFASNKIFFLSFFAVLGFTKTVRMIKHNIIKDIWVQLLFVMNWVYLRKKLTYIKIQFLLNKQTIKTLYVIHFPLKIKKILLT